MRWGVVTVALVACGGSDNGDVVGPFHGARHRYIVDRFELPINEVSFAADLDGDGDAENRLGNLIAIVPPGDVTLAAPDMVASSVLASFVEIDADSLESGGPVAVRYFAREGDQPTPAAGMFESGSLLSNRTRSTRHPGRASIRLPVFADADPIELELEGMEIDLEPDGRGGYDAILRGGIDPDAARAAAAPGISQMFETRPGDHLLMARYVDLDNDGRVSPAEYEGSVVAVYISQVDIQLFGPRGEFAANPRTFQDGWNPESFSAAFRVHLSPCEIGNCAATSAASCRNRILDGQETDLDCGGMCAPCSGAARCQGAADCETGACDAGVCRMTSCSDGLRDGFESDVDCGGPCSPCASGRICVTSRDCANQQCMDFGRCRS